MSNFHFNISLSVLNHLWRNLYRSFTTVLWEAISNSWDADAENVYIYIDKSNNNFVIVDDWDWMNSKDFSEKFLKIGYSKRKDWKSHSSKNRPFIWRKWIGKLALLSWADKIHIVSRKNKNDEYIWWIINNTELENSIENDNTPEEYPLGNIDISIFKKYLKKHNKGTLIFFENVKEWIRSQEENLRKVIALYFRFSLKDDSFTIYLEDKKIDVSDLNQLWENTEFFWNINTLHDPFLISELKNAQQVLLNVPSLNITWFVASVKTPKNLTIFWAKERIWIDLFVNWRVREKDILRHIPTARIAESYMYGQIHFDILDDNDPKIDRFTSSRESIVADDPIYLDFLEKFRKDVLQKVVNQWDKLRFDRWEDWNPENKKISKKKRAVRSVVHEVSEDYTPPKNSKNHDEVEKWLKKVREDAEFNLDSYITCFISENIIREFIHKSKIPLSKKSLGEIDEWKKREEENKGKANISIDIPLLKNDLGYLWMDNLANLCDKVQDKNKNAGLWRDAIEYKPLRNAVMHTALLTSDAKKRLTWVLINIVARIKKIIN